MSTESFSNKNKEISLLYNLYWEEKKIINESKIKELIEEFCSGKKIKDLQIKETSEELGKCIVDVKWDFSKDENKNFYKTISIIAFDKNKLAIRCNNQESIVLDKKDWENKKIIGKRIDEAFQEPFLKSNSSFPYDKKDNTQEAPKTSSSELI